MEIPGEGRKGNRGRGGSAGRGDKPEKIGPKSVRFQAPEVTQEELRVAAELQARAWDAHLEALEAVQAIQRSVERGAEVEPGPLEYNRVMRMVRTKKVRKPA